MTTYARCKDGILTIHEITKDGQVRIIDMNAMAGMPEFPWTEVEYYSHDMKTGKVVIELKGSAPVE